MPSGGRLATGKVCDKGACVNAERATTSYQWEKGLSGRSGLDQKSGMIFIFDKPDYRCMWMKGMKFNLDILWLDNNGRITKVVRNISPATYPVSFCGQNTRYVVEVNSGEARSLGWDIGDSLQL